MTVIVPTFNDWEQLKLCIIALRQQSLSPDLYEVIIVNNDPHSPLMSEFDLAENMILLSELKPGSYAARNKGIENTKNSDLIVFTDSDCVPDKDWLKNLLDFYNSSDKSTLVAGNVIVRSDHSQPTLAELYDISAGLPQQRYVSKGYAVTANLAVPRKVLDTIGSFDAQRFSGGDAEFCQRAIKVGFKLQFVPEAIVYHPARKTWQEYAIKVRRMKGGQIRAGSLARRLKYFFITLIPPIWRLWRILKNDRLTLEQQLRICGFQIALWGVELIEMCALILGKTPERR